MYGDHSPILNGHRVLVVEESDTNVDEVIEAARDENATNEDGGDEIFWIVFAEEPKRAWDFTEQALRADKRFKQNAAT